MNREIVQQARAYKVEIFICGNPANIRMACHEFCDEVGLCVTVTPTQYIYSGGAQDGFIIGLINYARFPKACSKIWETAVKLAYRLKENCDQGSFTVQDHERSLFVSTRDEDQ